MYGDIILIADDTWLVEGKLPSSIKKEADIANSVLYRARDTLYLFDTGATPHFKARLLVAIEQARPFNRFVLFNSHSHPDHTGNNSLIHEVDCPRKEHYLSEPGIARLDFQNDFKNKFQYIYDFYDYLDGPHQFPAMLRRLLKMSRVFGEDFPLRLMMKQMIKKFMPVETSPETVIPLEKTPPEELVVGGQVWHGWNFDDDVWVLEARGHSPDEVVFYLPRVKTLILADESFEFFNCWPDSCSSAVHAVLSKSAEMLKTGDVHTVISGHHHDVFRGSDAESFLTTLISDSRAFCQLVCDAVDQAPRGLTVNEIYEKVMSNTENPVIRKYHSIEYPKMPPFVKTVIMSLLLEAGYAASGPRRGKRFSKP